MLSNKAHGLREIRGDSLTTVRVLRKHRKHGGLAIHTVIIILFILKYKNILAKSFVFQNNFVSLQPI